MIIYKTTNILNGKIYIGQAIKNNPKYLGSGKYLKLAIKKYGIKNFKKEILEYINGTQVLLNEREKYWIKILDSTNKKNGYNISFGGQNGWMAGLKHSKKTKEKFSKNRKGKLIKEKNGMYGKKHTNESKNKMLRPRNNENNGMYGKHHTKKTKQKMSIANSGIKNGMYGKKHTEESKKIMRKKAKNRKAHNKKRVLADGMLFQSCTEVALHFEVSIGTVLYRCNNKKHNWKFI